MGANADASGVNLPDPKTSINIMLSRPLSLFMAFMTIGANYISLCPAGNSHAAEVHFLMAACTAHECNQSAPSHSCGQHECEHDFCNDLSLLESSFPRQNSQFAFYTVPIPVVIADIMFPADQVFVKRSPSAPPASCMPLFVPLRI